jgi:hypothetical protein
MGRRRTALRKMLKRRSRATTPKKAEAITKPDPSSGEEQVAEPGGVGATNGQHSTYVGDQGFRRDLG